MQPSKLTFALDSFPLSENAVFPIYPATHQNQRYYAKLFNNKALQKWGLSETIEYNSQVLTVCDEFLYPQHFLKIKFESQQNDSLVFLTEPYQYKLDQLIKTKGRMAEPEALTVFSQLIKAVYSLWVGGYVHRNLRAEHFVLGKDVWKLQSLVYEGEACSNSNQYSNMRTHQPPEVLEGKKLNDDEVEDRMVWDLGNILIYMLTGKHLLSSAGILNRFKGQAFSFDRIGVKDLELSEEVRITLGKMCHYDEKKRYDIKKFFKLKFLCKEVAEHYRNNKDEIKGKKEEFSSIIKKPLRQNKSDFLLLNPQVSILKSKKDRGSIQKLHIYFRTQIERCKIMQLNKSQIQMIKNLYPEELQTEITAIVKYCGYFVTCIILRQFFQPILEQKICILNQSEKKYHYLVEFAQITEDDLQLYKVTPRFRQLSNQVKNMNKEITQKLTFTRQQIKHLKQPYHFINKKTENFFKTMTPETCSFLEIKQIYRRILFIQTYSEVAKKCQKAKEKKWGELCCKITFMVAVDKLFLPDLFYENFESYFHWCLETKQPLELTLENYEKYLQKLSFKKLGEESSTILRKFYSI